jgi:hypothetical protein
VVNAATSSDSVAVTDADSFVEELLDRVRAAITPTVRDRVRRGRPPTDRPLEDLVVMMVAPIPDVSVWDDAVGPFYSSRRVGELLGVTRQALAQQRQRRRVLTVETSDGQILYPAFQFDARRQVVPGLAAVLAESSGAPISDWTLASFLRSARLAELGGRSILDHLRDGGDPATAVTAVKRAAARWAV